MRIGIDCRLFSSNFTGIGRYTHELVGNIIELNRHLKEPHQLVLFFNNPEFHQFKTIAPIKKILVNAKHYSIKEQTRFLRLLNKEKLDHVHFPHFNVPIFYRRPYTVTIHDLTLSLFPGRKMTKWYHRLAYYLTIKNATKKAKKIIAVSQNTKDDIVKLLKRDPDKIEVIHHGINPDFTIVKDAHVLEKTLHKYHIKKEFLLYTGVWRDHKNLPRLIHAFKKLKEKNYNLQLVITGKADPNYPEVKNTVKKLDIEGDVIFPGLVEEKELIHLYNAAHIFVFPSLYEGFGLPPLEAMRCGTPVTASNNSSIPEVCGIDNALFFDPENTEDIAEKIETLYKDSDLQAALIEKGIRHTSKFTWEKMAKKTFNVITRAS
ncbi:MAG: glycosyltransferase family 1 protein [bacterium]|nr:glycosyltransferase family 1 protein [bacterium]